MSLFPLFDGGDDLPPQAARLGPKLRALADEGIYLGTSSWKYEGWLGSIYNPERYVTRGKHSKKKFEEDCLGEYGLILYRVGRDGKRFEMKIDPFDTWLSSDEYKRMEEALAAQKPAFT
jgi:hypothetical protein